VHGKTDWDMSDLDTDPPSEPGPGPAGDPGPGSPGDAP